ncbi:MAG: hypothetical protein ACRC4M_05165 [Mycoplasma sp.]
MDQNKKNLIMEQLEEYMVENNWPEENYITEFFKTMLKNIETGKKNIFIITAVSGAGKDFAIQNLSKSEVLEKVGIDIMKSTTSRAMRDGEQQGREYVFVSKEEMLSNPNDYIETQNLWEIMGNLYAYNKNQLNKSENLILFSIPQKIPFFINKIKEIYPEINIEIVEFIIPLETSIERILLRNPNEAVESVLNRIKNFQNELNTVKELKIKNINTTKIDSSKPLLDNRFLTQKNKDLIIYNIEDYKKRNVVMKADLELLEQIINLIKNIPLLEEQKEEITTQPKPKKSNQKTMSQ